MGYEVVQRIAERISDHNILSNAHQLWKCESCGTWGQGMNDFAHHVAAELVSDLSLVRELQWIPSMTNGGELGPVSSMADAEYAMKSNKRVQRVDREFRFVSRWFRPSRDG